MIVFYVWLLSLVLTPVIASSKKQSVAGFLILAFFLGPIALLIALLMPDYSKSKTTSAETGPLSLQQARDELMEIKEAVVSLQRRITRVEENLSRVAREEEAKAVPVAEEKGERAGVREAVEPEPEVPVPVSSRPEPGPSVKEVLPQKPEKIKTEIKEPKEGFEFVFGKYWLNRIGVVVFFLGIAFFINYTFRHLNAVAKISVGYLCALVFFFWGSFLEKKENYVKVAWGLLGGAWALLYLCTYAMHYIQATRIISNAVVELWLLVIVTAAAIIYNLKYRSWIVTSITFVLAFITAGLGEVEYSTIAYCALLTGSIVFLAYKLDWYKFLLFGVCGTYVAYAFWLGPRIFAGYPAAPAVSLPLYQFHLSFGVLSISWVLFLAASFLLKFNIFEQERTSAMVASILCNAAFYTTMGLSAIYRVRPYMGPSWDARYWFLAGLAVVYVLSASLYKVLNRERLIIVNVAVAFTLVAMAVFVRFPRLSIGFFWTLEMAVIFALGVYYREFVYRTFAGVLSVFIATRLISVDYFTMKYYTVFGMAIRHDLAIFLFVSLFFYLLGLLMRNRLVELNLPERETRFYRNYFVIVGAVLFTMARFPSPSVCFFWTVEIIALFALGLKYKEFAYRTTAGILSAFVIGRLFMVDYFSKRTYPLLGMEIHHDIAIFVFCAIIFCLFSLMVRGGRLKQNMGQNESYFYRLYFAIAAAGVFTLTPFPSGLLSFFWAMEMAVFFALGIYYRESIYRIIAGFLSFILVARLMVVDLISTRTYHVMGADIEHNLVILSFAALVLYVQGVVVNRKSVKEITGSGESALNTLYGIFGTVVLTSLLWEEVASKWLSSAWALEGILLLGVGFLLKHKVYRVNALCVLCLACLRLVIVDMAGVNTIYKILTFITLGLILVVASLAYSRFAGKEETKEEKEEAVPLQKEE